ncbi:uncharacterized protein LOC127949531 [Carassius gibelio]|uniref:uncharacterized protein LOC127949531 n=1 Tax=Carassius gibelio TaxID=101364 RepID=UPI00227844A7|nr:uncharacterized protein LOC127949531 [Carassius gibelio]
MKFLRVIWLWMFLSEFNSSAGEISRRGYSEGNITITCSHSWASTNNKYFCRDPCGKREILVKSHQTSKGRYTLKDFGNGNFAVNIIDLLESDSGIYWCGVDRVGPDTFQKVKLIVSKANTGNREEVTHQVTMETQTSTEMHSTKPRLSVFISSTTKDSTLSLTSTGFVEESGPAGEKTGKFLTLYTYTDMLCNANQCFYYNVQVLNTKTRPRLPIYSQCQNIIFLTLPLVWPSCVQLDWSLSVIAERESSQVVILIDPCTIPNTARRLMLFIRTLLMTDTTSP